MAAPQASSRLELLQVRQMFDERRQTTVKGIDRSYPLEPLENKPRKQTNGNGVQKNGNLTVSRQSVTVKRVARADVNSNLNGGKPVVSYHEEIARESFGPSARQQDDDEFGIENHVAQYSNGNHRDETHIEEVVDQDTIERNRMMAKLHLMEYDETLKHRVKNDLESEEFPEDFMVDVPDKLPKQSVTKKLSQAEARLKRFKNANAKRGNNVTKSQTIALKKRTDPIFPAKFSPRECRVVKDGTRKVSDGRSNEGRKSVGMVVEAVISETVSSNSEMNTRRGDDRPRFSREESEKSAINCAIDSNTGTKALKEKNSKLFREESEMSATAYAIDPKILRKLSSESFKNPEIRRGPKLFDKEFEKSVVAHSKTVRKLSPELSKGGIKSGQSPKFFRKESENSSTACAILDSKTARKLSSQCSTDEARGNEKSLTRFKEFERFANSSKTVSRVRSETPKSICCDESEKLTTDYAIDSTTAEKFSSDFSNESLRGDATPKFYCEENEKSATTYATNSKNRSSDSPDYMRNTESYALKIEPRYRKGVIDDTTKKSRDADGQVKRNAIRKSSSPECLKSIKAESSNVSKRLTREKSGGSSPQLFDRERRKSATIGFDQKHARKSLNLSEMDTKKRSENHIRKSPDFTRKRSNTSPQFFSSDSDRSATIMIVTPETIAKPKMETADHSKREERSSEKTALRQSLNRNETNSKHFASRFFSEQCEKTLRNEEEIDEKKHHSRGSSSPLSSKGTPDLKPRFYHEKTTKTDRKSIYGSSSRDSSPRSQRVTNSREETPEFFRYESGKSATTVNLGSSKHTVDVRSKGRKSIEQRAKRETGTKSKTSTNDPKNRSTKISPTSRNTLDRRSSDHTLRSTKLIRDTMRGQSQVDYVSIKRAKGSIADGISKRDEAGIEGSGKVDERAGTPVSREIPSMESSPKSCTSVEVDVEIQEITMPDQYVKQPRDTCSKSGNKTLADSEKSRIGKLFTYSVRKPVKQRRSLFESNVFEEKSNKEKRISQRDLATSNKLSSKKKIVSDASKRGGKENRRILEGRNIFKPREETPSPIQKGRTNTEKYNGWGNSPSPTNESIARNTKRKVVRATDRKNEAKTSTDSSRTRCRQDEILKSMELVRRVMRGSSFLVETVVKEEQIDITARDSTSSRIKESEYSAKNASSAMNYGRTDSVESALRRFDSIGTETGSIRSVLEESTTMRRQTESDETYESNTISLKALDRSNLNLSKSPVESFGSSSRKISTASRDTLESRERGTEGEDLVQENAKKLSKARIDSVDVRPRSSATCKRKLFHDADSGEETGSTRSKCSLDSVRTVECLSARSNKKKTREHSVKIAPIRLEFDSSDETSRGATTDKGETGEASTGADRSLSVKRLRSIEDIRKSIEGESESVIESGNESGRSGRGTGRSEARRINIDDRAGNREGMFLPGRSGSVAARNKGMGDTSRSAVKCAMRFPRVVKSPSPETMKTAETSNRARRNVPPSPSKSPDTMPRRASTELKAQDTKSSKRGTPMKGAEPIGNRKTMTTTTSTTSTASTRKSTDVVDGAILENGLHLRDQTAETKYDNDSPTMKKSDAFVIDFDEQPPKENDAPLPRKSFLRKQSTEKQITPTQSLRTPLSISSTSSGISTQNQTSVYRSKMASRAKTPISSTTYKGSASNKNGGAAGGVVTTETLVPCKACGRRFAPDRVALHEQICIKTGQKKRKQFDTMMYRVKGTDIEPFVKKGLVKKQMEKSKKPEVKSNWRRKHEDFINAIRSAKQVQAHLAAGGKLSDLPPPPVSDNYDYIQCPHCGRKFNKAAADRHIPKCEHMLHNKPIHSRAPKPKR
ncbi:uncharacterized protein LOC122720281 isoform X2 [Apis laboriosa]|uniref:uncharacterized protein LOC122720281 isoform X2 n=1 Tax=Apis laboriosa TaxID=183418 RepID=UPI001CC7AF9F|nr:uncharacterized protein LOC122720281 isoform X2 [Apis laboriosa]